MKLLRNQFRILHFKAVYTAEKSGTDRVTQFFFSAHVISEIVTQTDVRIKKRVRTRVFSGLGATDVYGPQPRKNTGPTHPPKHGTDCLQGQK